jgi:predicted nucleotidyltransferase
MLGNMLMASRVDKETYSEIVRRICETANPQKIVLFGSRARGDHRPDSDIDLLIIKESSLPRHRRAIPLYSALADLQLGVDTELIVYTPAEVEEWRGAGAALVTTALREGTVLYEG